MYQARMRNMYGLKMWAKSNVCPKDKDMEMIIVALMDGFDPSAKPLMIICFGIINSTTTGRANTFNGMGTIYKWQKPG